MADPQTPQKALNTPIVGSDIGTWGTSLNNNFTSIDSLLGATQAVALSSANVVLTQAQANNLIFNLTGTLLVNVTVSFPAIGGLFIVNNQTTGDFTVTINTSASGSVGVEVAQGDIQIIYLDGTNAHDAAPAASAVPSGTAMLFAQAAAPTGWTQVTTNNDTALRVVSGAGGTVHGTVGLSAFISGGTQAHALVLAEIPSHSHGVNDPEHAHTTAIPGLPAGSSINGDDNGAVDNNFLGSSTFGSSASGTGITIQENGGNSGHNHGLQNLQYLDLITCTKN